MSKENIQKIQDIQKARCYATVFRDDPWNEAFVNQEGKFLPATDITNRSWRNLNLLRAYPLRDTAEYIRQEQNRPDSVCITICNNRRNPKQVTAFGWGFSFATIQELIIQKWAKINEKEEEQLIFVINKELGNQKLWYLSEVGVLPKNQGQGLGKEIVNELLRQRPQELPVIMRTNADSPMTIIAQKIGMQAIVGPNSTLAGSLGNLPTDPSNPNRVLYILKAINQ